MMGELSSAATAAGTLPRPVDWNVVKAAIGGSLCASLITATLFAIDARLHPTGGPLDLSGAGFFVTIFAISLMVAAPISLLTLAATVAAVGGERLRSVPTSLAALLGGAAGIGLLWLAVGFAGGDWQDIKTAAFGSLFGACVAGTWSHLVRR